MIEEKDYFKILDKAHSNLEQELKFKKLGFKETNENSDKEINNLAKNKLFDYGNQSRIYFAHVTTRESEILEKSKLMCSSGCLVGSIFCFPVYRNKNDYSMHNLGKYIFQKELSLFAENANARKMLLIEITNKNGIGRKIAGLNYLKLGNFHFNVYEELKFLLNEKERSDIDMVILEMIENSKELIYLLSHCDKLNILEKFDSFYDLYVKTISLVPIFGYFLFEIISEFIIYNQNDENSKKYSKLNEIYVGNFKSLSFKTIPRLTKDFNLGIFKTDLNLLKKEIKALHLDYTEFKKFIIDRSIFFIEKYLFDGEIKNDIFLNDKDLDEYRNICPDFIGHILHRIIRKMNRYPDFHINFDTYKAIKIWNYWNKRDILIPFNNITIKGEVGINPVFANLKYKIFKTNIIKDDDDDLIFQKGEETNVKIVPQLVELDKLMMRRKK